MNQKKTFLIGAHVSIAGGFKKAFERAESIGCTCMQIFTKSNQQWRSKAIDKQEAEEFKKYAKHTIVQKVVVHASYLINIGSPDTELEKKSVTALQEEVERCAELGIPYLVLHPGSAIGGSVEHCLERIAANLDQVLNKTPSTVSIVLENTAGQGSAVGYSFEQLAAIRTAVKYRARIGFCFDTCHAFAAGYDFRTPETYAAMWQEFDTIIGLEHLKVMHLNDSKQGLDSHVDRHEDIGKGKLGKEPFALLLNDQRFFDIPKILETPYESLEDYIPNLQTVRSLINAETAKTLKIVE